MQDNTITLLVNDDNDDGTTAVVTEVFNRAQEFLDRSVYFNELHSMEMRNTLGLYRTFPKPTSAFRGTAKSAVKVTEDQVVNGTDASTSIVAPAIANADFSFPVGMSDAAKLKVRMRLIAVLLDDAIMVPLINQGIH